MLNLTKDRRQKLLIMLKVLFPEYKHISVKRNTIVTLKRRWYSFSKLQKPAIEICVKDIPLRVKAMYSTKKVDYSYIIYEAIVNRKSHVNLIDSLYSEISKLRSIKFKSIVDYDLKLGLKEKTRKDYVKELPCNSFINSNDGLNSIKAIVKQKNFNIRIRNGELKYKLSDQMNMLSKLVLPNF